MISQALGLLLAALCAVSASAHALKPAIGDATFPDGERWRIVFAQVNLEALIAGIGVEHDDTGDSPNSAIYDGLRELDGGALRLEFDGFAPDFLAGIDVRVDGVRLAPEIESVIIPPAGDLALPRDSIVTVGGPLPAGATAITFSWSPTFGDVVIRAPVDASGEGYAGFLTGGAASAPMQIGGGADQTALEAFGAYLIVGFEHILPLGLDHILFVIGLFLLSTQLRPLLIQVTAFTLAHTVTLALGALQIITIPGSIVEPLIALSITYVAVENIFSEKLSRWRPVIVMLFGLLHGLGFAGVLSEFGFAQGQFVASLIAFNIGVELGQLAVIAACFALVGWASGRDWYRPAIVYPVSLSIGGYALAWFFERSLEIELPIIAVVALTVALGAAIFAAKGAWSRLTQTGGVLVCAGALTVTLRLIEGMIP